MHCGILGQTHSTYYQVGIIHCHCHHQVTHCTKLVSLIGQFHDLMQNAKNNSLKVRFWGGGGCDHIILCVGFARAEVKIWTLHELTELKKVGVQKIKIQQKWVKETNIL